MKITADDMQKICPSCAESMKQKNMTAVFIDFAKEGGGLSPNALKGLCEKFGDAEGFRTRCIESGVDVEDKGAFCNWLKIQCHGSSTAESVEKTGINLYAGTPEGATKGHLTKGHKGGAAGESRHALAGSLRRAKSALKGASGEERMDILDNYVSPSLDSLASRGMISKGQHYNLSRMFYTSNLGENAETKAYKDDEVSSLGLSPEAEDEIAKIIEGIIERLEVKEKKFAETYNIKGVEIFAEGEWNGDPYTTKDIDELVSAFVETKDALKPYLKLGHNEKQDLLKADGLPAAGWISNIYRNGKKLVADFVNIPKKVYELIKAKAYARVSSEIFINPKVNGKVYPKALKAVALLGGDTPAVQTLDDIHALHMVSDAVRAFEKEAQIKVYELEIEQKPKEDEMPEKEEVKPDMMKPDMEKPEDMEGMKAKFAQLEKDYADLKAKYDAMCAEKEMAMKEKKCAEIKAKVDGLVNSGKLAPAQKDFAIALLEQGIVQNGEIKFAHAEKEYKTPEELVFALIEAGQGVKLSEEAKTETGKANRTNADELGLDLDLKAKQYMEKNKVTYKVALLAVSREAKAQDAV